MKKGAKLSLGRAENGAGWGYPFRMIFVDGVGLALVVAGFHVIRMGRIPSYWPLEVFMVSMVFCLLALFVSGAYVEKTDKLSLEYATVHLSSFLLVFPLLMTSVYAFTAYSEAMKPARAVVIPAIFSFALLSLAIRRAVYQRMIRNKGKGYFAVLGWPDDLRALLHELLQRNPPAEFDFKFHDVENRKKTLRAGGPSPKTVPWSIQALTRHDPNRVGIVMASHLRELPAGLHKKLAEIHLSGNRVYTAESFAEKVFGKILLRDLDEEWVLDRELNLMQSASYGRLKETLDRAMAFLLLLFFLPVIVMAAGAILLLDGRPVFYLQKRRGLRDEVFEVIKFRTMKNRREAGSDYTGEGDSRITLLGRILRPSRIDELPQLWNVLMGEMSLIGPRAEWVKLVERYEKEIPYYSLRHEVRPGLTGWAQVNFPYGSNLEDTREKLRYDLFYIRNHSFLLDFQIVLKTVYVVLAKVGGK